MSFSDFLDREAKIYRPTSTGGFEPTITWTLLNTVECMVDPLPMDKRFLPGEGKTVFADVMMYIEYTDIVTTDRVLVDDTDIYEVVGPDNPNSMGRHLEIYLKKLPAGTAMVIPLAVAGAIQTLTAGSWNFDHFYKITHQNHNLDEIVINSVTGSVDGALADEADYFKGQNEAGEWGIFIADASAINLSTEAQNIVINYDYDPT